MAAILQWFILVSTKKQCVVAALLMARCLWMFEDGTVLLSR